MPSKEQCKSGLLARMPQLAADRQAGEVLRGVFEKDIK
jgi:hypothetical protein